MVSALTVSWECLQAQGAIVQVKPRPMQRVTIFRNLQIVRLNSAGWSSYRGLKLLPHSPQVFINVLKRVGYDKAEVCSPTGSWECVQAHAAIVQRDESQSAGTLGIYCHIALNHVTMVAERSCSHFPLTSPTPNSGCRWNHFDAQSLLAYSA